MAEAMEPPPDINSKTSSSPLPCLRQYKWWLQTIIYAFLVLAGESGGTLLGRSYFINGGRSQWIATLVQVAGFPILFPFQWITTSKKHEIIETRTKKHHLALFYVAIGILFAASCMQYSIGLQYLPVTTFTLISASQLGFNALFSYFLNEQNFTPHIVNSLVLLTISSILPAFQTDPGDSNKTSGTKYVVGFLSTLAASASHALMLSLTQIAFVRKIIKKETIRSTIDLTIYQSLIATFVVLIGLFASGDWETLEREMKVYKLGHVSYVTNLFWASVSWQALTVGCVGLIFKVSSLFSNVVNILGLSVPPILAVFFLNDEMTGLKAVAMLLATWAIVSFMYQHYLEDWEMKNESDESDKQQAALELSLT